ncbi:MAG: hypothetical protein KatS3mg004_2360 [Bryobacteraceae bacterium]|nr:MAG: hypothetical protein KatS3mg004_2360 [Bryobacteraceae bacterium]
MPSRMRVYLTIDTESSMGGAWQNPSLRPLPVEKRVFCRIDGKDYGIGWQCDRLEERGLRATFFCEVLCSLVLGEKEVKSYLDYLLERGQDVQLHVHPNYYFYAEKLWADARGLDYSPPSSPDAIGALSPENQATVLSMAVEIFEYLTGRRPVAFRAGSYSASLRTLAILSQFGVRIDSSFNPVYHAAGSFSGERLPVNRPFLAEGLLELPITVVRQSLPAPNKPGGLVPLEICALSEQEMRASLDRLHEAGLSDAVIVHHSFACVKAGDVQYRRMRPDKVVMRRFETLLDHLAAHPERFEVLTMDSLAANPSHPEDEIPEVIPSLGYWRPLMRTVQQAVNLFM